MAFLFRLETPAGAVTFCQLRWTTAWNVRDVLLPRADPVADVTAV